MPFTVRRPSHFAFISEATVKSNYPHYHGSFGMSGARARRFNESQFFANVFFWNWVTAGLDSFFT